MTLRLKPGTQFLPVDHEFTDPRTKMKFCAYQLSVDGAVNALIDHRRANPATYPQSEAQWFDFHVVKQEFFRQVYEKNPSLFREPTNGTVRPAFTNFDSEACSQCGSRDLDIQRCPTCSGNRILSKTCRTCGAKL